METEWQRCRELATQAERERRYDVAEGIWAMAVLLSELCTDGKRRLAFCLDRLGHVLTKQRKCAQARHFLNQSWGLRTQLLNSPEPEKAATLNLIAEMNFVEGKPEEAEQICKQVYQLYVGSLGAEHPQTKAAVSNLAAVSNAVASKKAAASPPPSSPVHSTSEGQIATAPLPQLRPPSPPPQAPALAPAPVSAAAQANTVPPSQAAAQAAAMMGLPLRQNANQVGSHPAQAANPQYGTGSHAPPPGHPQPQAVQAASGRVVSPAARAEFASGQLSVPPTKPKAPTSFENCEKCGNAMTGTECLRCTGTSIQAISPYDKLT